MFRAIVLAAALALAGCEHAPGSKYPSAEAEPQSTSPAMGEPMRSSAKLVQPAGAGASAPARREPYPAAVVRNLALEIAQPDNLRGADLAAFHAARTELAELFGAAFREALKREGYVRLALPGPSGADVLVIQPTALRFSAGYNTGGLGGIKHSELEVVVEVSDARGTLLRTYAVSYGGWLRSTARVPRMDVLRRVFPDAGEQVAKAVAKAR